MRLSQIAQGEPEIFASIQGEGMSLGAPSVFVRLAECNLRCEWCFAPETPVLMSDWTWRPIGELNPRDELVAFKPPAERRHGKLVNARVVQTSRRIAGTVIVNGNVTCTPEHQFWLTGKDAQNRVSVHSGWREIIRCVGARALYVVEPPTLASEENYRRGWLAGISDGDGCFWTLKHRRGYRRYRLALIDEPLLARAEGYAHLAGYSLRRGKHNKVGFTGAQTMSALWLTKDAEARAFEAWLLEDGDASWAAGYLGGILDAEGSHSQGVLRISQYETNPRVCGRIERVLTALKLEFTREETGFYVHRSNGGAWRALAHARPAKARLLSAATGYHPHVSRVITSVVSTHREQEVVQLTTTAGSFIAAGFVVKNCDTKYTWDWDNYDRERETIECGVDEVTRIVVGKSAGVVNRVVITGGEPLLQQEELTALLEQLKSRAMSVEIETNGAIEPKAQLAALVDQWNVSPKLTNSGNALPARLRGGPLTWFASAPNANYKFVISTRADIDEVDALVSRFGFSRDRVLLMPEATNAQELATRGAWLAEACVASGFRFTTRLHVALWDTTRGR